MSIEIQCHNARRDLQPLSISLANPRPARLAAAPLQFPPQPIHWRQTHWQRMTLWRPIRWRPPRGSPATGSTPLSGAPGSRQSPQALHDGEKSGGIPWFYIRLGVLLLVLLVGVWRLVVDRMSKSASENLFQLVDRPSLGTEDSRELTLEHVEERFGKPQLEANTGRFTRSVAYVFNRGFPWNPPYSVVIDYQRGSTAASWTPYRHFRNDEAQIQRIRDAE